MPGYTRRRGDVVPDHWAPLHMMTVRLALHGAIGVGHPLVLAQMFEP